MNRFIKIVIFIFLPSIVFSQNDTINKYDKKGRKIGYWKCFHNNGNIESEGYYKVVPINAEELFMRGIYSKDSLIYNSRKIGKWKYYNEYGKLYDSYFNDKSYDKKSNIINVSSFINDTLKISQLKIEEFKKEDNLRILNFNNQKIIFRKGFFEDSIIITNINSPKNDSKFKVLTFGYNLSSDELNNDFKEIKTFKITDNKLYFYRKYRSSEMKIYKYADFIGRDYIISGKAIPIFIFPLSLALNEIDLSNFKKGKYIIRTIDYHNNKNLFVIIELK